MATNLHIDEKLLAKAVRLGGGKTKRETVNDALEEFVRKREAEDVIALFGTIDFDASYDYKEHRKASTRKGLKKARGAA
jgi:hypothetical protein